ncbi:MAG: ribosomal protein S18-alanine N-acetyltransferase [Armatimonadetes bacterium]|nr:ribosomal protein S18-alanine N-acetyltransferase [Armatimonadota bacterium]
MSTQRESESTAGGVGQARLLVLRRARLGDLPDIMAIERSSFPTPWSEQDVRREITAGEGSAYLVAEVVQGDEHEIAGYVGAWLYAGEVHILTLAVHQRWRKQGLGERLMLEVLNHAATKGCDRAVLEYRVSNKAAAALYAKLGFKPVAIRPHYYIDNGEDAVSALMDDLATPQRQQILNRLRKEWEQRHDWQVVSSL